MGDEQGMGGYVRHVEWDGMRARYALIFCVLLALALGTWQFASHRGAAAPDVQTGASTPASIAPAPVEADAAAERLPTSVYAHNLLLHKGPSFKIYILWLRGQMLRTSPARNPSFDDPDSFVLDIQKGVIHVQLKDLATFLSSGGVAHAPLTNISIIEEPKGELQLRGTMHKLIPLPVQLTGSLSATKDNLVHLHVTKLDVLKVPFKGLLGGLHVSLADLIHVNTPGIQVAGNDVVFDTQTLLPAPHIRGALTSVSLVDDANGKAIEAIYGGAKSDPTREQQWHNFLQLAGGSLDFGKLTMHKADLIMVDASKDPWFDLDLINYQAQLVNGITRMTPQAGLQIFMPDVDDMPKQKAGQTISMEWLKHKNLPPPALIPQH